MPLADVIPVLERLVAFETISSESNLPLIDWVQERLESAGIRSRRIPDAHGDKANLLARLGPAEAGGIVLSGHTDVVPVAGQPWSSDPFLVRRDGDRLYGRGTSDMKGFIAVVLAALEQLDADSLRRPLYLALSYDEEVGALGAPALVEMLRADEPPPAATIVGEPSNMRVVTAHKGLRGFSTVVTGKDAHSSQPHRGANAIAAAARIVAAVDELARDHRTVVTDEAFDPPYTSFNIGTIRGGQAINIIARECSFVWEYRPVPADDGLGLFERIQAFIERSVVPDLEAAAPDATVETEIVSSVPALVPEQDGVAERIVREISGYDGPAETVAYGTDGGHFQRGGCSTVVFGPGSIDQAHQPDEYITTGQLEACVDFVSSLVSWASEPR